MAATLVSTTSILVNTCVLIFAIGHVGRVIPDIVSSVMHWMPSAAAAAVAAAATTTTTGAAMGVPTSIMASSIFAILVGSVVAKVNGTTLSNVASACVTTMFVSFVGLLGPAVLSNLNDLNLRDVAVMMDASTAGSTEIATTASAAAFVHAAPIMLMSLIYQNIVPTVTKLLKYDAPSVNLAIGFGSFIPLLLYETWCYVGNHGGTMSMDTMIQSNPCFNVFTISTLIGSMLGTTLSLSEELQSLVFRNLPLPFQQASSADKYEHDNPVVVDGSSPSKSSPHVEPSFVNSVACSVLVPLAIVTLCGGGDGGGSDSGSGVDLTTALQLAGSIGSPLLYGILPAIMWWNQQQQQSQSTAVVPPPLPEQEQQVSYVTPKSSAFSLPSQPFVAVSQPLSTSSPSSSGRNQWSSLRRNLGVVGLAVGGITTSVGPEFLHRMTEAVASTTTSTM